MLEREAYFKNFTTQLFRTVQDVPHHQWPTLFGRMIEDYHKVPGGVGEGGPGRGRVGRAGGRGGRDRG